MNKEQIEKVVNKFILSYGEEPNDYKDVFYNSKKNIGINLFSYLCAFAEDLSQPTADLEGLVTMSHDYAKTKLRNEIQKDSLYILNNPQRYKDLTNGFKDGIKNLQKPVESDVDNLFDNDLLYKAFKDSAIRADKILKDYITYSNKVIKIWKIKKPQRK